MKVQRNRWLDLSPGLARICEFCPHLSDEVLDLHLSAERRCPPGVCAKALFKISGEAADAVTEEVKALFAVIPGALVVEARGPGGEVFEKLPFDPNGTKLREIGAESESESESEIFDKKNIMITSTIRIRNCETLNLAPFPFDPDPAEDMESYCRRVMDPFSWDRDPGEFPVRLQFSYT